MKTQFNKIIIVFIVFCLILSCSENNIYNHTLKTFNLNGKVKSFKETQYRSFKKKENKWNIIDKKDQSYSFCIFFNEKGEFEIRETYNQLNNIIEKTILQRENKSVIGELTYDVYGELKHIKNTKYLSNKIIEETLYDTDSNKLFVFKSMYNKKGYLDEMIFTHFNNNELDNEYTYFYKRDKDNKLLLTEGYNRNQGEKTSIRYEYVEFDKYKNWTKCLVYDSEEAIKPIYINVREYKYY